MGMNSWQARSSLLLPILSNQRPNSQSLVSMGVDGELINFRYLRSHGFMCRFQDAFSSVRVSIAVLSLFYPRGAWREFGFLAENEQTLSDILSAKVGTGAKKGGECRAKVGLR